MDITRDTFDATKGFRKVIFQKGRPPFDAEFNEAQDNILYHAKAPASQWLTRNAASGLGKGFRPKEAPSGSTVNDFAIERGVIWRNGEFYELTADILYSDQVDENGVALTALAPPSSGTRADVVYLDVYEAEISGTQDTDIVDPTYGVETARRIKKMALVRVHNLASVSHGATPSAYLPSPPAGHLYFVLGVMTRTTSTSITNAMITQWGLELWVAEAGDDANNGLRQTTALRTIQEAINRVPMYLYEDVRILVLANSEATSTDAGTGDSYWQEDLRIENVFGQPRDYIYDAAETDGRGSTVQTEADGVQSPVYRLVISSYTFNDTTLGPTSFFYLDGSITIRNCNGVKLAGVYQRSSPTHGYLVDNSVNVSIIQAISESSGGDGFRFVQSSVDVFQSAAFAAGGVGMKATQSTVQLMDTFWIEACPIGVQATHGANILIMDAPAEYSDAFYAGVDYRQILNCTTGLSAVDGGKIESYFTSAPASGERLKIGGGAANSIGVHARFGGQVELSYADVGNITNYHGPQVAGVQADNNGVLRLNQVSISGLSGITGNQIATFTGIYLDRGKLITYDAVSCLNYTLAGMRVHNTSSALIAPNGSGTSLTIGFSNNKGSSNHPVVVSANSVVQVVGGGGVNQVSLQIDGYHGTYAGTKPLAAFAIRSCSVVRVTQGSSSTAVVVVNNVNGNASVGLRECVADLRMNSAYLGNSNTKLDTSAGSSPVKSGAGTTHYSVENAERTSNGVGAGLTLTGHNDVVSNSDDGGTL